MASMVLGIGMARANYAPGSYIYRDAGPLNSLDIDVGHNVVVQFTWNEIPVGEDDFDIQIRASEINVDSGVWLYYWNGDRFDGSIGDTWLSSFVAGGIDAQVGDICTVALYAQYGVLRVNGVLVAWALDVGYAENTKLIIYLNEGTTGKFQDVSVRKSRWADIADIPGLTEPG